MSNKTIGKHAATCNHVVQFLNYLSILKFVRNLDDDKTLVESVKLGKILDLRTSLSPGYFGKLLPTAR